MTILLPFQETFMQKHIKQVTKSLGFYHHCHRQSQLHKHVEEKQHPNSQIHAQIHSHIMQHTKNTKKI